MTDKQKMDEKDKDAAGEVVVIEETAVVSAAPEKKDRFLPISILIAAVLIGGAVVFASVYRGGGSSGAAVAPSQPSAPQAGGAVTNASVMQLGPRDAILGNANAPVTLIEYGDYQCPFCTRFFSQTQPQIVQNYVNTGKVRMVFRDFPFLGPESLTAAEAAQCAEDQNKFWAYHEALYQAKVNDENKGGSENDGFFTKAVFLSLAGQTGLNIPAFTTCIDSNTDGGVVNSEKAAAVAAGVNSTPTFYANGTQILGAEPYQAFQSVIDTALAGK